MERLQRERRAHLVQLLLAGMPPPARHDQGRRHGIDPDLGREGERQALGQMDGGGLGDGVGHAAAADFQARDGGHVEDDATAGPAHGRCRRLGAEPDALDVDIKSAVPLRFGHAIEILHGDELGVAGVVHQHVKTAELPLGLLDQGRDRGRRRDVRLDRQCLHVGGLDLLGRRDGLGLGAGVVHDDVRAGRGQQRRDRLAHAGAATRDDRDLPLQIHGSLP